MLSSYFMTWIRFLHHSRFVPAFNVLVEKQGYTLGIWFQSGGHKWTFAEERGLDNSSPDGLVNELWSKTIRDSKCRIPEAFCESTNVKVQQQGREHFQAEPNPNVLVLTRGLLWPWPGSRAHSVAASEACEQLRPLTQFPYLGDNLLLRQKETQWSQQLQIFKAVCDEIRRGRWTSPQKGNIPQKEICAK